MLFPSFYVAPVLLSCAPLLRFQAEAPHETRSQWLGKEARHLSSHGTEWPELVLCCSSHLESHVRME